VTELFINAPPSTLPAIPPAFWLLLRAAVEIWASTFALSITDSYPEILPTIPPA
jgi:hypothetical protein